MTVANAEIRPDRIARGIGLILLSTLFTSLQDVVFKSASSDVTLWQLYVLRSLLLIPALLVIASIWGGGGIATISQSLRLWPMVRALLFVLMYFSMYAAIPVLPLSAVAAGIYTAPLFVAALSPLVLGEPMRWRRVLAIVIGFAGVLVILRPGTGAFSWLMLMPVMAGFFYALSALVTRSRCRSTPPATLAMALGIALLLVGVLASGGLSLAQLPPLQAAVSPFLLGTWSALGLPEWGLVVGLAALMVANGLVLPAAYQSAPPVIIATFDYTYLIFATFFGFVLFSEIPDMRTLLGILMIAGAGLMVARG